MSKMICKKDLILFYFLTEHVWDISEAILTNMCLEILNTIFLNNFWLILTSQGKVSCQLNYHYNKFIIVSSVGIKRVDCSSIPEMTLLMIVSGLVTCQPMRIICIKMLY